MTCNTMASAVYRLVPGCFVLNWHTTSFGFLWQARPVNIRAARGTLGLDPRSSASAHGRPTRCRYRCQYTRRQFWCLVWLKQCASYSPGRCWGSAAMRYCYMQGKTRRRQSCSATCNKPHVALLLRLLSSLKPPSPRQVCSQARTPQGFHTDALKGIGTRPTKQASPSRCHTSAAGIVMQLWSADTAR